MSYCRFSSDNFKCEVYVFDDCMGGITTYVAGNRCEGVTPIPEVPPYTPETADEYFAADDAQMRWLDECTRVFIDLPYAGQRFNHDTEKECAENLIMLKELGYNIPQYVIDTLMEESDDTSV